MSFFTAFEAADDDFVRRERAKAKELRDSQWWKNLRGQGKCHWCQQRLPPAELSMDHIVPVIRGGSSSKSNIVPCCKECNSAKKYLLPIEWEEHLNRLRSGIPAPLPKPPENP
jgi:5-methylcytosine-specific restriction endonuclease McrA